jgi:hypothetical protein
MRALLAITLIFLGGTAVLPEAADARQRARSAKPPIYSYQAQRYYPAPRYYRAPRYYGPPRYAPPPYAYRREQSECERRAEAEDPSGQYAGYPCWARSTFGRTPGGVR